MQQAVLVKPKKLIVRQVPLPVPAAGEARIMVDTCGICGSDVHAFLGEHPFITTPIVPGHEFSGIVDALGPHVAGLEVGMRVTVEPGLVCGECALRRAGRYNICEQLKVLGCQATGAMAEYVAVPARNVVPLLQGIGFEEAALVEPTAVAVHALRRVDLASVERLLVVGAGPIGLQTLQVAAAWGIPTIVIADVVGYKLQLARELGATYTVDVSDVSLAGFLKESFGKPNPMDLVMECVGSEAALTQSIEAVRKGGRIVIVGVPAGDPRIRLSWVQDREIELLGTLMYVRADFVEAMELIAEGRVRTKPLVTGRFSLARVADAMADLLANRDTTVKTLIAIRRGDVAEGSG